MAILLILALNLAACSGYSTVEVTVKPAAINTPTMFSSNPTALQTVTASTPALITTSISAIATATPIIQAAASTVKFPLDAEVNMADQVFQGQVTKIENLIWNTPDGKEPDNYFDAKYRDTPQQFAPVEVKVLVSHKGNLTPGNKITILLPGAPGAKPFKVWQDFPKINDTRLWFTSKEFDFRRGLSSNPLVSLAIQQLYTPQADGKWLADNGNTLNINNLDQVLKNSPPPNTSLKVYPPTATPKVKPGQPVNLVKFYELDKAQSIFVPGTGTVKITDTSRLKNILNILDTPLNTVGNPLQPQDVKPGEVTSIIFFFGDGKAIGLEYDLKFNNLTNVLDQIRVPAPVELRKALGLG